MYVTKCGKMAGVPTSRPPQPYELGGYDDTMTYGIDDEEGGLGLFGIALPALIGGGISVGKRLFGGGGGGRSQATIDADARDQARYYQMALAGDTTTIVEGMTPEARLQWEASPANAGNPQEVAGAQRYLAMLQRERSRIAEAARAAKAAEDARNRSLSVPALFGGTGPSPVAGVPVNTLLLAGMGGLLMFTLLGKRR